MITATEARKRTDEIIDSIKGSIEFKAIMAGAEQIIITAISDEYNAVEISSHTLPVLNNSKIPTCVNQSRLGGVYFWLPYIKTELEKNGFEIVEHAATQSLLVSW